MYGRTPSYGHGNAGYSGYGYGQQQPPQQQHQHRYPPAGADPQLWQWFSSVDSDGNGTITANELQQALVNGDWSNFDLDTVKMLMGIFDTDRSGTIGYNEFAGLWKYISDWQDVFRHFDQDRSGSIDRHELSNALRSFGYNLTPQILMLIEQKYGKDTLHDSYPLNAAGDKYESLNMGLFAATPPSGNYGPPPGITFDRFVRACVAVKTLTEAFQRMDVQRAGWIQVNYEQFMKVVLSAP